MSRQESKQQSELPRHMAFDMIASMKSIHTTSSFSKKLDDEIQVLGHCSSEWLVPTMVFGACGGFASAFNPLIGGLLGLAGFLCSIALLKSFLKTVEKIAKASKS